MSIAIWSGGMLRTGDIRGLHQMVNPEKIPDTDEGSQSPLPIDGLTAEEQSQLDAMNRGEVPDGGNVDPSGDEPVAEGDDPDIDDDAPLAADGDTAVAGDKEPGEARPAPKTVSYGKHQRELNKLQKARDDLQARLDGSLNETKKEREERIRLNERTQMLLEAISAKPKVDAPTEKADPEPDGDEDPIGHSQWKIRQLEKTVSELREGSQKREQATAAETEENQVYNTLVGDINREAAADPTFIDAFVHLRESRFQELGFIYAGIDINDKAAVDAALTPKEQADLAQNIQRSFHNEQLMVARQSIAANKSPASVIRNLARARGWVAKAGDAGADKDAEAVAAIAAAQSAPRTNGNGKTAPRTTPAPSVKEQLSAVRDNLDASRSLSDAGGSPGGQMTPQRIADMSPEEFERYYDSIPKDQFDRMMGKVPQ